MFYNAAMDDREQPVVFGAFDPAIDVEITQRNLPHWFQPHAAIFVTFRTADSLPKDVVLRWQRELEEWLAARGLPVRLAESTAGRRLKSHEVMLKELSAADCREFKRQTDRAFHMSLDDCHGACLLQRPDLAKIVGDAILFFQGTSYDLDRFVVMPNHVHAIVQFRSGANLKTVSESWMRYSARKINSTIGRTGALWQPEPFDHIIRSAEQFEYLQRYIAENPQKAGLNPGEYLYWERESM
jgi:REP element-mobilizing transposase RayT